MVQTKNKKKASQIICTFTKGQKRKPLKKSFCEFFLSSWPLLTVNATFSEWHKRKAYLTYLRSWISYVDKNPVISLDAAAEHTHLCDDKQKGLSGPLRIARKHCSDKPNFAQGFPHLLEN